MPLLRSAIATGLLVIGLNILVAAGATEAVAATDCPCKQIGNSCVPDLECEAARRLERERQSGANKFRARARQNGAEGPTSGAQSAPAAPSASTPARNGSAPLVRSRAPASANGHAPPAAAPAAPDRAGPAPVNPTAGPMRKSARARPRILETGYSHLTETGKEVDGYGLYSYAILPSDSDRAARFLGEVFKEIPSIGSTSAQPSQLNIFYVPLRKDKEADFTTMLRTSGRDTANLGAEYTKSFYDYRMARALLDHVCNPPDPSVLDLCNGDLSRGPYIFTYASPASKIEPVPPPFLFVDLSDVHERAFGELLAAFQAQVKREDISDQARIKTMRLNILQVALTAADWVSPVQKAIADIVRSASGGDDDKK